MPRMQAMLLERPNAPLVEREIETPVPGPGQILIRVRACGVCRTDLHVQAGELPHPKLPLVLGHEIVGTVIETGPGADRFSPGALVGVPWLGWACGVCRFCRSGRENLCERARFTGYDLDGGYAELAAADERFCFPVPPGYDAVHAAPLLCAGLIGYRSLVAAGDAPRLGLYGFGAAAHIVAQLARATPADRHSPARSARCGPAAPTSGRPSRSTRPSSSRPSARWCRLRSGPPTRGAP